LPSRSPRPCRGEAPAKPKRVRKKKVVEEAAPVEAAPVEAEAPPPKRVRKKVEEAAPIAEAAPRKPKRLLKPRKAPRRGWWQRTLATDLLILP
jgi:ribonuclease E